MNSGSILGLDSYFNKIIPYSFISAKPIISKKNKKYENLAYLFMIAISLVLGVLSIVKVKSFDIHSVHDPAMVLFIMCVYLAFGCFLVFIRIRRGARKEFRSFSLLRAGDFSCKVLTLDISHRGMSFILPKRDKKHIIVDQQVSLEVFDPVNGKILKVNGMVNYIIRYGLIHNDRYLRVGLVFSKTDKYLVFLTNTILSEHIGDILARWKKIAYKAKSD